MRNRLMRSSLELRGPMTGLKFHPAKPRLGVFGVISHAQSDGDDETGQRARRRRFSGVPLGQSPPGKTE
eukprot:626150-Alexandrium_andersonii.AAC.1